MMAQNSRGKKTTRGRKAKIGKKRKTHVSSESDYSDDVKSQKKPAKTAHKDKKRKTDDSERDDTEDADGEDADKHPTTPKTGKNSQRTTPKPGKRSQHRTPKPGKRSQPTTPKPGKTSQHTTPKPVTTPKGQGVTARTERNKIRNQEKAEKRAATLQTTMMDRLAPSSSSTGLESKETALHNACFWCGKVCILQALLYNG